MEKDKKISEELTAETSTVADQSEAEDHLEPNLGESYEKFVADQLNPGTPSFLAHQLMSNFDDEKKKEAEDIISKTLLPADLVTYIIEKARTDPEANKAFSEELRKRLAKFRND
jgi:hypothetical protein